jgi:hypothetical protein
MARKASSSDRISLWPLALLGVLASWLTYKIKTPHESDSTYDAKNDGKPSPASVANPAPSLPENLTAETICRPDQTPWWKTFGEGAAIIGGIGLLIVNFFQMKATQQAADATTQATVRSTRPWVGVQYPIEVTSVDWDNHTATYVVTIKNYGPSVALHLAVAANIVSNSVVLPQIQNEACERSLMISKGTASNGQQFPPMTGETMFPTDGFGRWFTDDSFPVAQDSNRFWIVGCITYSDQFEKPRVTRFCNVYYKPIKSATFPIFLYSFFGLNDAT